MHETEEAAPIAQATVGIEELRRRAEISHSAATAEAEKQVRITLHPDWRAGERKDQRTLLLSWNPGGRNGRKSVISLEPGKSVMVPLSKAFGWFGPFHVPAQFEAAKNDPRQQDRLVTFWDQEKKRILDQYDYPRGEGGYRPDMSPKGPHRFPDVSVTIIDNEGVEDAPIRLHQLYEIGAFDKKYPIDSFGDRETVEQVRERARAELAAVSARYEEEARQLRLQMAETLGMVKALASAAPKPVEAV